MVVLSTWTRNERLLGKEWITLQVGQQIELTVLRGKDKVKVKVTLADQKITEEKQFAAAE